MLRSCGGEPFLPMGRALTWMSRLLAWKLFRCCLLVSCLSSLIEVCIIWRTKCGVADSDALQFCQA